MTAFVMFSLLGSSLVLSAQDKTEQLKQEAYRRNDVSVKEGFRYAKCLTLDPSKPTHFKVYVPSAGKRQIKFWMESLEGSVRVEMKGPDQKAFFSFQGSQVENAMVCDFPKGICTFEMDASNCKGGRANLDIEGTVITVKIMDAFTREIAANPKQGFHWPYLLFTPKQIKYPCLLVRPNNTGFDADEIESLRFPAIDEINHNKHLAEELGCPLLVPIFPRPSQESGNNLYLHALTRDSLLAEKEEWKRVDLQLIAMMDDARAQLKNQGLDISTKALFSGFSASGSFVSRFSMLHPERALAVVAGGLGGWPIAPLTEWKGKTLTFPLGLGDFKQMTGKKANLKAIKAVPRLYFRGESDLNDDAIFRDSYAKEDELYLFQEFGNTPLPRWKTAEQIYRKEGMNTRFIFYPDTGHEETEAARSEMKTFFEAHLKKTFPEKAK